MNNLDCSKTVPSKARKSLFPDARRTPHRLSTMRRRPCCGKRRNIKELLAESLEEVVDLAVEIRVPLAEVLDLPDRVDHRRVMLAAEAAADLGQRRMRQ